MFKKVLICMTALSTMIVWASALSSADVQKQIDETTKQLNNAHQMAQIARSYGEDDTHDTHDTHDVIQYDECAEKPVSLNAVYTELVKDETDKGGFIGTFKITHYCPCATCNGRSDAKTASGTTMAAGRTIAVDPKIIPLGSKVYIEGYGWRVAEDTGGAIKNLKIDMCVSSHSEAYAKGVTYAKVYVK